MPKILLVDDDAMILSVLERHLRSLGHEVQAAGGGEEGAWRARTGEFDAVLTDLVMPGTDGLAVVAAARGREPGPAIIVMTGEGTVSSAVSSLKGGAADFLCKPFPMAALDAALDDALARRAAAPRAPAPDELARLKSDLLAMVGHELRTPLSVVLGYTNLLLDGQLGEVPDESRRALSEVSEHASQLARLVAGMLELSALEAGTRGLELEEVSVAELVRELSEGARAAAERKGLRFEARWAARAVRTDRKALAGILGRLLDNAVKFTASGSVVLRAEEAPDGGILFAVEDTGPGIAEADRAAIFQSFRQLEPLMTRAHGGTGLGLALCDRLARLIGARIRVHSEPGRGATFEVLVRAAEGRQGWGA